MENLPLKYLGYTISFQEVPNEISLIFNISGCPYKCKGCHSTYLWEYKGNYLSKDIDSIFNEYLGMFTCVCFMGGDTNLIELRELLKLCKSKGLTTCIYSGTDNIKSLENCMEYLDFIKYGSYKKELKCDNNICYGVKLATSNQKMLKKGTDY
jgi:anaerobic ribonucleoside-triphosphate reductase activating protein